MLKKTDCVIKKISLFVLAILFALPLTAESFRVHKTVVIPISTGEEQIGVQVGINDGISIKIPQDKTFIQGIEVIVKIPPIIAEYKNTIVYSLYNNISPVPTEDNIDYTGKELYTGLYPGLLTWTIQIPLIKGNTIKKTPYADKTLIPETSRNFLFIRNQLAMKGVPQSVVNTNFTVYAKPILSDKGALKINTTFVGGDDSVLSVKIDDKIITPNEDNLYFLKPGLHNVMISAEGFRNEIRSVVLAKAEVTELAIDLFSTNPLIKFSVPTGTKIWIDEHLCERLTSPIAPGEHIIKFEIGGYEVQKNVLIQNGKTYNVSCSVDAIISSE